MAKEEITSLDLRFLVKELNKTLAGGVIKKIYEYGDRSDYRFLFEIYSNRQNYWLYFDKRSIYLSNYKKTAPETPPSFCMFLRKHLLGRRVMKITQYKFDRIIEIQTKENTLVIELFSDGNAILADSSHKIIMPLTVQSWKDRSIKPKLPYLYPPSNLDPFRVDLDTFRKIMLHHEKVIAAVLATVFGFGKDYANEICQSAKVDPNNLSKNLTIEQTVNLYGVIEKLDSLHISPLIYTDTVTLFPLDSTPNRKPVKEGFKTISEAFEEYFSSRQAASVQPTQQEKKEKKIERIVAQQKKAEEKFAAAAADTRSSADIIYLNYSLVDSILSAVKKALKAGKKWQEIKQAIEKEDTAESRSIKEVRENEGIIVVSLSGKTVELDINKSVEQNAEQYYMEAKKSKRKLEGVKTAIEKKAELQEPNTGSRQSPELDFQKERRKWYEKFKWFVSSTGLLVIAGRDATQNEQIVKKHAESKDFLMHADIHGAAFVLIKSEGKPIDEVTMKEAAEFSAANSKAWIRGIPNADVYAFRPEQATKPEGSLEKGSFVIQGQRIWFRDMALKLSIGIKIDREKNSVKVISGPVMSIRKHSSYFVTIEPGYKDSLGLSREIKNKILQKSRPEDRYFIDKIPIGDIQVHIPSGKGEIVE